MSRTELVDWTSCLVGASLQPITEIGVHEAKTRFSELLRLVENGEDVVVTRGGRPVARLSALKPAVRFGDKFGMLADECGDVDHWEDDPELAELFGISDS